MELKHFRIDEFSDQATTVWIDVRERPVNVLWEPVFGELETLINRFEGLDDDHRVLFRSAKPTGFIVGADLKRIAAIQTDEEAEAFIERGQRLFDRLARVPPVTVAVIEGPCLGGGLEFALACRYRVARNDLQTRLGVPETSLGLLPAWGGTQRLAELIGLPRALWMILSSEPVDSASAWRLGLVDAVVSTEHIDEDLSDFVENGISPASHARGSVSILRPLEGTAVGRWWTYAILRRQLGRKLTQAQKAAWDAVVRGWRRSYAEGLTAERKHFCELLKTPECREALERFVKK